MMISSCIFLVVCCISIAASDLNRTSGYHDENHPLYASLIQQITNPQNSNEQYVALVSFEQATKKRWCCMPRTTLVAKIERIEKIQTIAPEISAIATRYKIIYIDNTIKNAQTHKRCGLIALIAEQKLNDIPLEKRARLVRKRLVQKLIHQALANKRLIRVQPYIQITAVNHPPALLPPSTEDRQSPRRPSPSLVTFTLSKAAAALLSDPR